MRTMPLLIAFAMLCNAATPGQAQQYNQPRHLDVGSQAKIGTTIVRARTLRNSIRDDAERGTPRCGEERDGVIVNRRPGGEKVIVVTKDIVNTGGNVEIGASCR
jgi:hypothetical protein